MEKPDRVWAEIDLDNLAYNVRSIKKLVKDTKIAAVIKADAYGHGAVECAHVLCENDVYMLVVATLEEGIALRHNGNTAPILILGHIQPELIVKAVQYNMAVTVTTQETAECYSRTAKEIGQLLYAHIKIDTGMNRVGIAYDDTDLLDKILSLEGIHYSGIFSHFSTADEEDKSYTEMQYRRFLQTIDYVQSKGVDITLKHICNSGGVMLHPDKYMDMVRPGIILYGLYPSEYSESQNMLELQRVMSYKSRIIQIKKVKAGSAISYGNNYVCKQDSVIATVACGYADGYSRALSNKTKVWIKGRYAPVVGNICMDMLMVDITSFEDIKEQDEVELFGPHIDVRELAEICGTINYEFICKIGARVPRVYIRNGQMVRINRFTD